MESVRSKKVRSRRTPVANLASFAPRERLSANRDRRGAAASRTPPISAVRVRLTQLHLFRTAAPGHRVALPAPVGRPLGYPRPGKHTGAHPSARGKGPSSAPVSAPTSVRPSLRASFQHPRRGVLRTAAPATSQPVAQRCISKAAPSPCVFASHPPFASIELQSHPRRSDEIAIHPRIAEALPKFAFHPFQKRVNGVA